MIKLELYVIMVQITKLYSYLNGNVQIELYEDGTKTQEWEGIAEPIFPNSMDIKITNYCDLACKYCHEESTVRGKHGRLGRLITVLKDLPPGTELAIGGGNPLDHPKLLNFLKRCKKLGLVCNLTVNSKHIPKFHTFLNVLMQMKLIYGLGISVESSRNIPNIKNYFVKTENIVFHVISGILPFEDLEKFKGHKVLVLGYKEYGFGTNYINEKVKKCKQDWFDNIESVIGKIHLSFDNLAIEQLDIKRFLTDKQWDIFYTGNDGQFTMYLDAVNYKYATSSTAKNQFPIDGDIKEIFKKVRLFNNF